MGRLKRMLGLEPRTDLPPQRSGAPRGPVDPDQAALERYRYLLRTAPPETIEQAHAEAFAALTPEQRQQVLAELSAVTPENERPTSDDPQTLARTATRAEMRNPGTLERSFGGMGPGSMLAGSLLASLAGAYIGTTIAAAMLADPSDPAAAEAGAADAGADAGADPAAGGGDWGSDYGGGDYGGGDWGGGDFGGGDFGGGI